MINSNVDISDISEKVNNVFNEYCLQLATPEISNEICKEVTRILSEAFPKVNIQICSFINHETNKINLLGKNPETIELINLIDGSQSIKIP